MKSQGYRTPALRRRSFLTVTGASVAAMIGASGCSRPEDAGGGTEGSALTVTWWGEGDQNTRQSDAIAAFAEDRGVEIETQPTNFEGYFDRLATQVAGGNAPDVFQLYMPTMGEYADRNALHDLSEFLGETIDDTNLETGAIEGSLLEDQLFFLPLGLSTQPALIYDRTVFAELGAPDPDPDWTLDDYVTLLESLTDALGSDGFGSAEFGGDGIVFEAFVRSKGKEAFTTDGALAFESDDLREWLQFWEDLRQRELVVHPRLIEGSGFEASPLITGQAPIAYAYSSKGIQGYASLTDHDLDFLPFPRYDASTDRRELVAPVEWMGLAAESPSHQLGAELLNFLVNDEGAARAMGIGHGVPVNNQIREAFAASGELDPLVQKVYDNVAEAIEFSTPRPMYPAGASELLGGTDPVIDRVNQQVAYGEATVGEATEQFFSEAERLLG
ncbi:ABC transporter substrate-binding protein [Ruania alba]|uniref:Multiple sugar transport system substrate-binding protein n=1 Tax=Ruania alba TaxID=648782 RepID=A0A1H5DHC0_9MICO|nr:ABC transporter substrate-binding protein [Ruania alba]SED78237.1 multiple sugar transport system substrate-binding protein [Ruania alba]